MNINIEYTCTWSEKGSVLVCVINWGSKPPRQTFIAYWPHKIMPFFSHARFSTLFLFWSSDPCKAANCKHHSVCKLKPDGSTPCECPRSEECPDVNDPVCGTNGKTYESECKLKAESCAEGIDVTTKHNGVCGMKITTKNMLSLTCFLFSHQTGIYMVYVVFSRPLLVVGLRGLLR